MVDKSKKEYCRHFWVEECKECVFCGGGQYEYCTQCSKVRNKVKAPSDIDFKD